MRFFTDRRQAGLELAKKLPAYKSKPDALVLALPRGGVPVGFEAAGALHLPLDILLIRKLGFPGHEELAMGALAEGGVRFLNEDVVDFWQIGPEIVEAVTQREEKELQRRIRLYRGGNPPPDIKNKTVILVDDGVATGAGMQAAVCALRPRGPKRIIVAVPVAPPDFQEQFAGIADEAIAVHSLDLGGVGSAYRDFSQTSDGQVMDFLARAKS